jgi:plastocyanin
MCLVALLGLGLAVPAAMALEGDNATVSFGQWLTDPPLDRFPNLSPRLSNQNQLIPNDVTIKVGGAINFTISGFHQVLVYDVGTQPEDINVNIPTPATTTRGPNPQPPVVLIDDPTHRLYRGLDPSLQPLDLSGAFGQDRVEVLTFAKPGTYLVLCGIRGHFVNNGMFGFVTVQP